MSNQTVVSCFFRKDFFAAPNLKTGKFWLTQAGAVLATTGSKTPRMFVHAKRYRTFDGMNDTIAKIRATGAIDTAHWVEVDTALYMSHDALVAKNGGEVYRHGFLIEPDNHDPEAITTPEAVEHPDIERAKTCTPLADAKQNIVGWRL